MPKVSGIQALERISSADDMPCVIMLTSLADMETVETCLELGAANYIRKDTPLEQMKALILETYQAWQEED